MADKSISELVAATAVGSLDLFVLEQGGTAKKLTGQILENWLVALADGHGGIQTIAKTGTSGLVDTYTITYADTTTSTFTVTNGKAITGITQYWAVSTSDTTVPSQWYTTRQTMTPTNKYLWSYLNIAYNDSTSTDTTKSVVGVYGDTGAQTYVWIKYAGVQPTSDSDMGDTPDKWIGIYVGLSSTAPTSYTAYTWYQYKGEKGDTGDASEVTAQSVTYLEGTSGTVVPQGSWTTTVPSVTPGNFLWTKTQLTFNDHTSITAYSVSRFGIDGTGSVSSVNNQSPDTNGNVALNASNIPTSDSESVQAKLDASATAAELATFVRPNLLDNWYFVGGGSQLGDGVLPINQRGQASYTQNGYSIDRWSIDGYVSLVVAANCIKLSKSASDAYRGMRQSIKASGIAGRTVTLSVLCSSGTTGQFRMTVIDNNSSVLIDTYPAIETANTKEIFTTTFVATSDELVVYVRLYNVSLDIYAVKLELGDTQTLAHQESGEWVLNEIPDYAEQLAKCLRYYRRIGGTLNGYSYFSGVASSTTQVRTHLDAPLGMAKRPTITVSNIQDMRLEANGVAITPNNISVNSNISATQIPIYIDASNLTQYQLYAVVLLSGAYIEISAES